MLLLELDSWSRKRQDLTVLANKIAGIQKVAGSRVATEALIDAVGVKPISELDELYYNEAIEYYLGLMFAAAQSPVEAADHFELSKTLPHSGDWLVFSDQIRQSLDLREKQMEAVARGIPSVAIASMPRSASASLTQSFAATFGMAVMRVSAGNFPNSFIVPRWMNLFLSGGAILHDHFDARSYNIEALKQCGLRRVFVYLRDPRAAAFSLANRNSKFGIEKTEQHYFDLYESYISWLSSWCAAAERGDIEIEWITNTEAAQGLVCDKIARFFPEFSDPSIERKLVKANFVEGDDNVWRRYVPPERKSLLWEAIPSLAKQLLNLES